jgi:hypothetical protein
MSITWEHRLKEGERPVHIPIFDVDNGLYDGGASTPSAARLDANV